MKYLSFILVLIIFVACSDLIKDDFSVSAQSENAVKVDNSSSPWENGLVDHREVNNSSPAPENPIYFDSLQKFNYSDNPSYFAKKHFRLNNNSSEPMTTIQTHISAIDGIFVGIVRPNSNSSIMPDEELIIALSVIEKYWISTGCQSEKVKFYGSGKIRYFFKCTNRDLGTWVRIPTNDPLITKFNSNKRGYFIGKHNLSDHIFYLNANTMYFYIGYKGVYGNTMEIPQLMAVDKPYFSNFPSNNVSNTSSNPRYLSTIGGGSVPLCTNLPAGHWTIRPCPNNCPE